MMMMISIPIGSLEIAPDVATGNVGITNGGGGVNVGSRVGADVTMNWAAKVGSMVGV